MRAKGSWHRKMRQERSKLLLSKVPGKEDDRGLVRFVVGTTGMYNGLAVE